MPQLTDTDRPLPHYEDPPLDEVAIGVQFEPLAKFSAAHLGAYWLRIRSRYPTVEDNPPMPHRKEASEIGPVQPENIIRIGGIAAPRCWFIAEDGSQLIQFQRDQFFRNWRRHKGAETYPRYPALREAFGHDWDEFQGFVREEGLGEIQINQCELTYVNQIPKGSGWETFSDLTRVFTFLRPMRGNLVADPEIVEWGSKYKLPDGRGRVHIELSPAFRARDFAMVMTLTLRARGAPSGSGRKDLLAWYDFAREWVVRAFDELTTSEMHSTWKKRS